MTRNINPLKHALQEAIVEFIKENNLDILWGSVYMQGMNMFIESSNQEHLNILRSFCLVLGATFSKGHTRRNGGITIERFYIFTNKHPSLIA